MTHLSKTNLTVTKKWVISLIFFFSMLNNMIPVVMILFFIWNCWLFINKNTTMSRDKALRRWCGLLLVIDFHNTKHGHEKSKFIFARNPSSHVQSGITFVNHPKFRGYKIGVVLGTQRTWKYNYWRHVYFSTPLSNPHNVTQIPNTKTWPCS